jgi:penicillin-binding protein 2
MDKLIKPARMAVIIGIMVVMSVIILITLYQLQIIEGAEYYEASQNTTTQTVTVAAARGNILDRYGRTLVSNKACNNLIFNTEELFEQDDPNAIILQLAQAVEDSGCEYTDTMPITKVPPFEYVENMTDQQKTLLDAYLEANDLPLSTTAVELMAFFRTAFNIDNNYTSEEMRTIAGIRYEIKVRYVINTSDYIFAEDVSMDLITKLLENNVPGFTVQSAYVREYNTKYAAHILGNIAPMDSSDVKNYPDYSLNSLVGRDGAEYAFEEYLHGTDGTAKITSTKGGTVINTTYLVEPEPGDNITLTLDIGMQEAAENALNSFITTENATREANNAIYEQQGLDDEVMDLITGGAVAVVEIGTGEVLTLASWPTFDLSTFYENYTELSEAENGPLYNRALFGTYAPGSTFKPCTALASLCEGIISTGTTFYCNGVFDKYAAPEDGGYAPRCWIYPSGHGELNVTEAIQNSCNVFFYNCGDLLGIDKLSDYANRLGLGVSTGIELPEATGVMSTQEYKEEQFNEPWYQGDSLQAAIGQAYNLFTPLQMANYIATIADNGTRYKATILKSVRSHNYSESIFEQEPVVAEKIDANQEYYDAIHQGMYEAANSSIGTGYATFGNYAIKVATKTGTSQLGEGVTNNGMFVCYAPYDDPQIAICAVVEHAGSGAAVGPIVREVLDYYLSFQNSTISLETENSLLK